jgi:hypothetical protein
MSANGDKTATMESSSKFNGMGTWRRYKLGQTQFTTWLKQTAENLITRKNEPETRANDADAPAPQQSRREKKKAKINLDQGSDKFVHWTELEVLAQRVADSGNPDDIPDSALNILRDVVNLRKKSFRFFSSAAKNTKDEKLKQSNANHAHIISVLERVLARLESLVKVRRTKEHRDEPKDSSRVTTADLSNLFALLEVQAPPDAADGAPDQELEAEASSDDTKAHAQKHGKKKGGKKALKPKKPQKQADKTAVKAKGGTSWVDKFRFGLPGEEEEEEDEFDLYMMVYCFFEDFNTIRNYVAERWCDYWYERSVPLVTLAVITNAAFELFHQLEYDLVKELRPINPSLARYDFMMGMLFYEYGIDHIDYDSYDDLSKEETDERIWRDESDWLALLSCFNLQQMLEMIPPGKVPMIAPSLRRPTVYGATNLQDWKAFQTSVSTQIVMEGAHLKALKVNQQEPPVLPSESQLLLDFQTLLKRGDYNSAIIFSLHLWVDIRNIMEADHAQPFLDLQGTAAKLKQALEAHNPIKYCKDHDFKRSWLGRLWETKHYMVEDFMLEDKKARFRQLGIQEDPAPFFLLKHEPVWAGLLDFRARLVYSQLGHEFVALSAVVDAAAYLYNGAVAADPSLPRWDEMSKYVDTYLDSSRFKLGLQGQSPAAIISNFASLPSGRPARIDVSKAFIPAIAIRQTLYQRYAFDDQGVPIMVFASALHAQLSQLERSEREEVESSRRLLGTGKNVAAADGNGNGDTALVKHSNGVTKAARKSEQEMQRKSDLSQLSPIDMLQMLDKTVTSQLEGVLTLDYFKLFDESVALLEAVAAALGPDMQKRLGPGDGETPAYLRRLPVILGQDLASSGSTEQTEILHKVVEGCRTFFQKEEVIVPPADSQDAAQ